jgi:energy-coupling factor transporter ATP-binding protein EcfA2
MKPSVIVLDEPTSFLDPRTAEEVMDAVDSLRRENGIAVIVVEHRLDLVGRYAERIVVMDHGRIVADGKVEDVLDADFDRLSGLGIGLPKVSLLWSLLKRDGFVSERLPTHVESAVKMLSERLRN